MTSISGESGSGVYIKFPLPDQRLFRNQATEDILLLLLRNPHTEFTVTEIRNITEHGGDTIQTALEVLEAADLIQTQKEGRKKLISANRDRFHNPEDPLLSIPQEEFRSPVKAFVDKTEQVEAEIIGVILFGSVARGEADRASDIDIQVIVENNLLEARRELQEIRQKIEKQKFDGQRYEIQLLVESVETAENYGKKLQEIFSEGITLYSTDKLNQVREAVFNG
jgi:predicted nucleotidyltransferase